VYAWLARTVAMTCSTTADLASTLSASVAHNRVAYERLLDQAIPDTRGLRNCQPYQARRGEERPLPSRDRRSRRALGIACVNTLPHSRPGRGATARHDASRS
jgi:hypothetical protein